jgi:hypothetical protein
MAKYVLRDGDRGSLNASGMPSATIVLESQRRKRAQNGVACKQPGNRATGKCRHRICGNAGHLERTPENQHLQTWRAARGIGELREEREEEQQQFGQQIGEDPLPIHLLERQGPGPDDLSGEPEDPTRAEPVIADRSNNRRRNIDDRKGDVDST